MFQLTENEWEALSIEMAIRDPNRSQIVTSSQRHRSKSSPPYAFTEQGVSMLSSVLKSEKAININIVIMRAFVFMRQYALTHDDLGAQLKALENKYNQQFKDVYAALQYLMTRESIKKIDPPRKPIGFKQKRE